MLHMLYKLLFFLGEMIKRKILYKIVKFLQIGKGADRLERLGLGGKGARLLCRGAGLLGQTSPVIPKLGLFRVGEEGMGQVGSSKVWFCNGI